jgi:CheY-like chemotaxis protein
MYHHALPVMGVVRLLDRLLMLPTLLLKADPLTRAVPVIALTALAMKGDEERIRAAGCDGYIAKPIGIQDFLGSVAAQMARTM